MIPSALLAKSRNHHGRSLGLYQHLVDTEAAVEAVFAPGSRWQAAWLRFFRIPASVSSSVWRELRVAALFHDIGKANQDFQQTVTNRRDTPQSLRHEHLSALILCLPVVRSWLASSGVDVDLIAAAVLSHHVKVGLAGPYAWCQSRAASRVELFLQHGEVMGAFARVADTLGLPAPPQLPADAWSAGHPWEAASQDGRRYANQLRRALGSDRPRRRRLAALKAGLIVADSVASAMFREDRTLQEWLLENAHTNAVSDQDIAQAVLEPRAQQVQRKTGKFSFHRLQELSEQLGPRVLLIAPCGAGKTLAAWKWAQNRARQGPFGRVIFLYPTRGTATEGYRDYVAWAPEGEATLLHGTSSFEIAEMRDNPPDSLAGKAAERSEAEARMFALGLWRFRYFSATVDQFLSFLQNRYQSLCLLPALADSVVILDEVHSYDRRMFDLLVTFLEEFDVPVLCMTATLPPERAERLRRVGLVSFPAKEHHADLQDLQAKADHPRYQICYESHAGAAIAHALAAYRRGRRVLIVVNRVARCVEVARSLTTAIGHAPLVYHSRFRLVDRQARHREVVTAFQTPGPVIAVTTQVCEMSLDLDAQTLVTEVAPVPSLVQRFGRANRHLALPDELAEITVYPPAKAAPYEAEELEAAARFVQAVTGIATQSQLAACLENGEYAPREASVGDAGHFLTGGYFAVPGSWREEDEQTVQCVLEEDLAEVERLHRERRVIDGYVLPAPRTAATERQTALPPYLRVVLRGRYHELYGLED